MLCCYVSEHFYLVPTDDEKLKANFRSVVYQIILWKNISRFYVWYRYWLFPSIIRFFKNNNHLSHKFIENQEWFCNIMYLSNSWLMYCIFGASIFYEANKQIIANILHDCAHQMVCCQNLVFAKNLVSRKFPKNLIKQSK